MKQSKSQSTDANRRKILDAARHLILKETIDALSVRKLAVTSGLALRTIYNLYGSKENVLVALLETGTRAMDRLEAAMTRGPWKTAFYEQWLDQKELKPSMILIVR